MTEMEKLLQVPPEKKKDDPFNFSLFFAPRETGIFLKAVVVSNLGSMPITFQKEIILTNTFEKSSEEVNTLVRNLTNDVLGRYQEGEKHLLAQEFVNNVESEILKTFPL